MALVCPVRVLSHHLFEERRDVVLAGVARVADVLAVIMPRFERVILHRDQVERDVVEPGFSCRHGVPPGKTAGPPVALRTLEQVPTGKLRHAKVSATWRLSRVLLQADGCDE